MKKLCPQLEADEAAALRPANDSKPVFARLLDYASRGCRVPDTLTPYEIRQVSFGLLSRLALDETDPAR